MLPRTSSPLTSRPVFGIDSLLKDQACLRELATRRVAFLTNQKTLTQTRTPSAYALQAEIGDALKCILTPEHGWTGLIHEGLDVANGTDSYSQLPIFSLYGKNQRFLHFMDEHAIDVLLIDLQDAGLRCYTYAATCAKALEACVGLALEVIICDRPNPLGSSQKGPSLDPQYRSILAYLDVPFQHGKTLGQLLSSFNENFEDKKFPLRIYSCESFHNPYTYAWYPPSPNLPSWDAILLYPALVLLEGINVSEGRGTPFPFTSLGAPGLNHRKLVKFLQEQPHIYAESIIFVPQRSKFEGKACQGARIFLKDPLKLDAFALGKKILAFLRENYPAFSWTPFAASTPEENPQRYFIDMLMGTDALRTEIEASSTL